MRVLGIESSCDETAVAVYDADLGLLAHRLLPSQIAMHQAYGGRSARIRWRPATMFGGFCPWFGRF